MKQAIIILVAPQMGENIGATARVMKNFGFSELRIVNPRDGWPNEKADAMSVDAINIIKDAKIYNSLAEALEEVDYLYATTAQPRDMNKEVISSHHIIQEEISGQAAIMFGRESSGLSNEEISYANKIISIDTAEFSSLNLAQAVGIVGYEFSKATLNSNVSANQEICSQQDLQFFVDKLISNLDSKGFFYAPEKRDNMVRKIRNIFTRIDGLSQQELKILHGIMK